MLLALDIGGANLKAADGLGYAAARPFPLWRQPEKLADALNSLIADAPAAEKLLVTMTGELADCFATKAEGVLQILDAVRTAAGARAAEVYLTDGSFVDLETARQKPLLAAASNWRALAQFAGRFAPSGGAVLLDIGGTTTDIIPLVDGLPAALGKTDTERLISGELVYTGVVRSPLCAVVGALPLDADQCPIAQELFATTLDAYITLGDLPENEDSSHTADGRPATRAACRARLARSICLDVESFTAEHALAAGEAVKRAQAAKIANSFRTVMRRMPAALKHIIISGQGEFLARDLVGRLRLEAEIISLSEQIGPALSRVAPAHALAVLARERTT